MNKISYLDWNSYGLVAPSIQDVMFKENWANASSKHFLGQRSQFRLRQLTKNLLQKLGIEQNQHNACIIKEEYTLTYTSGATEANFTVLNNYKTVFVSNIEHPSVRNCPHAEIIPVDQDGRMDLEYLETKLQACSEPFLVSYMLANHETGIINDLHPVLQLTKKYGGHFHTDAVQAFGRIDINIPELNVDYMTIAPYKCGGMIGVGALVHKFPVKFGWSEKRPGTIPLPLIESMVESLELPRGNNKYLEDLIRGKIQIIGESLNRLPNTTCIACKNKDELMMILDMNRICISTGAACTAGTSDKAHSLEAMGYEGDTIRISSGWSTTEEDFARCADILLRFA